MGSEKNQRVEGAGAGGRRRAFTLIELLMVIAIIALLAALIVPLTAMAVKNMKLAKAQAELLDIDTVIKNYKATKGFYPPDNPLSFATNQLFYELNGAYYDPNPANPALNQYWPMYNTNIHFTATAFANEFNVGGIMNSSQNLSENPVFTHNFSLTQFHTMDDPNGFKLLTCPVHNPDGTLPTINYNVTNPTNNPTSYDLWIDLVARGKTNRICNWSSKPIVL